MGVYFSMCRFVGFCCPAIQVHTADALFICRAKTILGQSKVFWLNSKFGKKSKNIWTREKVQIFFGPIEGWGMNDWCLSIGGKHEWSWVGFNGENLTSCLYEFFNTDYVLIQQGLLCSLVLGAFHVPQFLFLFQFIAISIQ